MTAYCLELGIDNVIVHTTECGSYDLASLLGEGRVCSLGDFASPQLALRVARRNHPRATKCGECCGADDGVAHVVADATSHRDVPAVRLLNRYRL